MSAVRPETMASGYADRHPLQIHWTLACSINGFLTVF
jgi:hypothetical protein